MGFPHRYKTPTLTPTLTWRNTNSKGRAILALSQTVSNLPLSHPSHTFGAHAKVIWVEMRPQWLILPVPLSLPAHQFRFACHVFSGHCPVPAFYHRINLELFPMESPSPRPSTSQLFTAPPGSFTPIRVSVPPPPGLFPHHLQSVPLAPTLAWRNTNTKGRMFLRLANNATNLPDDHVTHDWGTLAHCVWIAMHPHSLILPIPLHLPQAQFSYAVHILSGHCMVGVYLSRVDPILFERACQCGFEVSSMSHRTSSARQGSSAPTSLPGDGMRNTSWVAWNYLPPGFRWWYITDPHQHNLHAVISLIAFQPPQIDFLPFVDKLYCDGQHDAPLQVSYADYIRLVHSMAFYSDKGFQELLNNYQAVWGHCIEDCLPSEDGFESDDTHRTPESPNICPIQKWKKSAPNSAAKVWSQTDPNPVQTKTQPTVSVPVWQFL
ncbi:hypothetical protein BOTBODRAFT_176298 [Botryobasidium botryosum FD-172 SS1]|uniref:Uncharacterized protein n=1 Tax=Botryobasidium botryosum (strain FD-172 SS1) TaxID=930990 RepID=A0A067MA18_BOTB1|nr:hypothetical protein BOTBODRAFT_176298 [Botryobasidium botryosum FD-172 SS1]